MSGRTTRYRLGVFAMCATFTVLVSTVALADENDPPTRVARLAYTEGSVSFQPAGTQDWVAAPLNRPLTTGDVLWSDQQVVPNYNSMVRYCDWLRARNCPY